MKRSYLPVILMLLLIAGCRKTENFYDQLENLPRANKLFNNAYAVGDTLVLTGKFGTGKASLSVTIGGVDAPVISLVTHDSMYIQNEVRYNYTTDQIKMLITEPMIGLQQPVVATVNGISSTVGIILVAKDKPIPARTDTICYLDTAQARIALTMPAGTRVVPNYTPGAPIIFVSGDSIISWQEGAVRRGKVTWTDNYGTFSVLDPANLNYGYASDPSGNNLYISCLTRDAQLPGATYAAIRLVKVSLQDYSLTTLNRTVIPTGTVIDNASLDLDTAKREGHISEVFLPLMKNLYVNKAGELYFSNPSLTWAVNASGTTVTSGTVSQNLVIGRINASGTLQYLAKGNTLANKVFRVPFRKNGVFMSTYDFIPNVNTVLNYSRLLGIDAGNGILYGYTGTMTAASIYTITTFYCYSLTQQRQLSEFTYKFSDDKATITVGPFNIVEGKYQELTNNTLAYQWLSPGQPMVIFALQRSRRLDEALQTVNVIDFSNRTVNAYAPYQYLGSGIYRNAIGGNVIGYTAAQDPVMVLTKNIDPSINEVQLLVPVK